MKISTVISVVAIWVAVVEGKGKDVESSVTYDDDLSVDDSAPVPISRSFLLNDPLVRSLPESSLYNVKFQDVPASLSVGQTVGEIKMIEQPRPMGRFADLMAMEKMAMIHSDAMFGARQSMPSPGSMSAHPMDMSAPAQRSFDMDKQPGSEGMFQNPATGPSQAESMKMGAPTMGPMGSSAGQVMMPMGEQRDMFMGRSTMPPAPESIKMETPQMGRPTGRSASPEGMSMSEPPSMFRGSAAVPPPLGSMQMNEPSMGPMGRSAGQEGKMPVDQPITSMFRGRAAIPPPLDSMDAPPMDGPPMEGRSTKKEDVPKWVAALPPPLGSFGKPMGFTTDSPAPEARNMEGAPGGPRGHGRPEGPGGPGGAPMGQHGRFTARSADQSAEMNMAPRDFGGQQMEQPEARSFSMSAPGGPGQGDMKMAGPGGPGGPGDMKMAGPGRPSGTMMEGQMMEGSGGRPGGMQMQSPASEGRSLGMGGPAEAQGGPMGPSADPKGRNFGPSLGQGAAPEKRPDGEIMPFNAISSTHKIEYRDVPVSRALRPATIEIEASENPITLVFKSSSSRLNVLMKHDNQGGDVQETFSEDKPHHLVHTVSKPVYQQVREVIMPHRRVSQEVHPLKEEIETVVARASKDKEPKGGPEAQKTGPKPGPGGPGRPGGPGGQQGDLPMGGQPGGPDTMKMVQPSGPAPGQTHMPMGPGGPPGGPSGMAAPEMSQQHQPAPAQPMASPPSSGAVERFQAGMGGGTPVIRGRSMNDDYQMEKMALLERLERLEQLLMMSRPGDSSTGRSALGGMRMDDLGGFAPKMTDVKGFKITSRSRARARAKA